MSNSIMEQVFDTYFETVNINVYNFGKKAKIDLVVDGFSEGNYTCRLLIYQFTSYVMRLAEISTYHDELTDEYIAEKFMDKTLRYRNTKGKFNMPRSDYGGDQYYGLSIHLDITDMYSEFDEEKLNTVVHWAWNHVGFPSLQTQLQMTFDEAIEKGIVVIDDSKLDEFYSKGWKISSDEHLEVAGTWQYILGNWSNASCDCCYARNKDLQVIRENWNKDIGDATFYAMYEYEFLNKKESMKHKREQTPSIPEDFSEHTDQSSITIN